MAITLRTTKGSELTHAELDANFTTLEAADATHLADTADAHAASAITNTPSGNLAATDVQSALNELQGDIDAHLADTSAAHAASAISYAGNTNLSATTVEDALDELDNEKQPLDATLTAISDESMGGFGHRNRIIGGDFTTNPWQRGTSFTSATTPANSDDTYLADRWYLLSDGNDIVDVTRAAGPTGTLYSLAMDVETANKKFGIAQIVEAANAAPLIGGTCSLSFKAKITGTSLTTIKAGVVAWSGTADTVTSDIISVWNADGVTPTLIANATFENTPADLNVTTDWATYKIEGISVDTASTTNLIVFIWCDNATTTVADFLYVSNVHLEYGPVAHPFNNRPYGTELALCQRYYYRINAASVASYFGTGWVNSATNSIVAINIKSVMRVPPTALEQTGTATDYSVAVGDTSVVCSSVPTLSVCNTDIARLSLTVASGLTVGQGSGGRFNSATAYIGLTAEL